MRFVSHAQRYFAVLGVLLFATSMSLGQIGTTSLRGNVLDKSHAAIGGDFAEAVAVARWNRAAGVPCAADLHRAFRDGLVLVARDVRRGW